MLLILMQLSLKELITAYHVNQEWRFLVPKIGPCTRLALLRLAFGNDVCTGRVELSHEKIPLPTRQQFASSVAHHTGLELPETFRIFITEWPRAQAPRGAHWPYIIHIKDMDFGFHEKHVAISTVDLEAIVRGERISSQHRLFNSRPRLNTPRQIEQTARFLRAHDRTSFNETSPGMQSLTCKVLALDNYNYYHVGDTVEDEPNWRQMEKAGWFYLILAGPCNGQIHAWSHIGDYAGFEAENFVEWRYSRLVPPNT